MEPLKAIEMLAEKARGETPPVTDVRMAAVLRACRRESPRVNVLAWPAAVSAVAAVILLVVAMHVSSSSKSASTSTSDSVTASFSPLQVQMP